MDIIIIILGIIVAFVFLAGGGAGGYKKTYHVNKRPTIPKPKIKPMPTKPREKGYYNGNT